MTESDKLIELAERCESASGPDRELDFAIADAVGFQGSIHKRVREPRFTASLDVALTLVPEGWDWSAGTSTVEGFPPGYAEVNPQAQPFPAHLGISTEAATPALALCAAALRARATQGTRHE